MLRSIYSHMLCNLELTPFLSKIYASLGLDTGAELTGETDRFSFVDNKIVYLFFPEVVYLFLELLELCNVIS